MAHAIADVGKDWLSKRSITDGFSETIDVIAVGSGETSPSSSDEQLANELSRSSKQGGSVTIDDTSNTGVIRCTVSITGGTEVEAGSSISEFGLFTSDGVLIYREVRDNPVVVESGDTKTFEFRLTLTE